MIRKSGRGIDVGGVIHIHDFGDGEINFSGKDHLTIKIDSDGELRFFKDDHELFDESDTANVATDDSSYLSLFGKVIEDVYIGIDA